MEIDEVMLYQRVGESVRRRRKEVGMTQSQLAAEVGVLRTSVTNIETGRQKAPLHLLVKICAALGMETREAVPDNGQIVLPENVPVEVDGEVRFMPPKAAEALEHLQGLQPRGVGS